MLFAMAMRVQDGRIRTAIVGDSGTKVGVLCTRLNPEGWEPTHMVKGTQLGDLPSCFSLNDEALEALDRLIWATEIS